MDRITLRPSLEPIIPPESMRVVRTITDGGPNALLLEHCHYAYTREKMYEQAPEFHLLVRVWEKGSDEPWHMQIGAHYKLKVRVVIESSHRLSDDEYNIAGRVLFSGCTFLEGGWIKVQRYSVQTRRSNVFVPRSVYCDILSLWRQGLLETA